MISLEELITILCFNDAEKNSVFPMMSLENFKAMLLVVYAVGSYD